MRKLGFDEWACIVVVLIMAVLVGIFIHEQHTMHDNKFHPVMPPTTTTSEVPDPQFLAPSVQLH